MCNFLSIILVILFVVFNSGKIKSDDLNVIVYKSVEQCKNSERYDLDLFQCVECNTKDSMLVASTDRSRCVCQPTVFEEAIFDSSKHLPLCKNISCASCPKPNKPECKMKYIESVARNASIQKTVQIFYSDSRNCSCDTMSNIRYHDYCIAGSLLRNYQHYNSFQPERDIYSQLKFIAFFCKVLRNTTACNHLANLCVSSFYSLAKNSPCTIFYISQASDAAVYRNDEDSEDIRPFLFYRKIRGTQNELEKPIDFSYTRSLKDERQSELQLVSVMHSLDGSLVQIGNFLPYSVNFCNRNMLSKYNRIKFGFNYATNCKFNLENLMAMNSDKNYFYSIYLNYTIGKIQYLQPVPVLVKNAFKFNEGDNPSDWQLVKRFQLYDSHEQTTIKSNYPPTHNRDSLHLSQFKMIRYLDRFELFAKIYDENRIALPLIVLRYKTIYVQRNTSMASEYQHNFRVNFTKSFDLNFYFELLLPLTMTVGLVFAILRTFNYKTRQNKEYCDFSALCQFVLYLFSNLANALFFVAVFIVLYVFFVTTGQNTVKLMVPIKQQDLIDLIIAGAFAMKLFYLLFHFWRIVRSDVFFIDWERPRGYDSISTHRSNSDTPSVCSSVRSISGDTVSAWRNFFVANEWIKLSTKRKTSILFQNLIVLVCLEICTSSFQNFANPIDKTIQLALVLLLQFTLYATQTCMNLLFVEKIYGNPLHQFTDVCSTANISVFLLLHDSYGFYVHGRSPHGFSDVDMSSIIVQLQREAHNMCSRRGLLTGSDNQSYIILVPTDFRTYYNKLLIPFQKAASISQSHFEREMSQGKSADHALDRTTAAYGNINRFFCAFIDHSIKDLDYLIKERTFIEVLLNCEFESYLTETKGTFYIDNWQAFGKVLLYGNDFQIFLCELMIFCLVLVCSDSLVAAAFVMSVVDEIFQIIFRRLIKSNVANKTLIDRRFLI